MLLFLRRNAPAFYKLQHPFPHLSAIIIFFPAPPPRHPVPFPPTNLCNQIEGGYKTGTGNSWVKVTAPDGFNAGGANPDITHFRRLNTNLVGANYEEVCDCCACVCAPPSLRRCLNVQYPLTTSDPPPFPLSPAPCGGGGRVGDQLGDLRRDHFHRGCHRRRRFHLRHASARYAGNLLFVFGGIAPTARLVAIM